jgi:DNA-binding NarL/FixJ family response regulator
MEKTEKMGKSVVIIDDHPMTREGIKLVLSNRSGFRVTAEAGTAKDGLEAVKKNKPDFVILDLSLPDRSGLEIIKKIRALSPISQVIVLTMYSRGDFIRRAVAVGAKGYIVKGAPPEALLEAVRRVEEGWHYFDEIAVEAIAKSFSHTDREPGIRALSPNEAAAPNLSKREREILHYVALGGSIKEIAFMLSLSPKTVENHRYSLMRKLKVAEPVDLIKYALRKGIVEMDEWLKEEAPDDAAGPAL